MKDHVETLYKCILLTGRFNCRIDTDTYILGIILASLLLFSYWYGLEPLDDGLLFGLLPKLKEVDGSSVSSSS